MLALLPLGTAPAPALLIKAGRSGGHGVIVTAEALAHLNGRAERLLPLLPAAGSGSSFSRTAVPVPPMLPPLPIQPHWPDIGLAWQDVALIVPQAGDVLPALVTVLAAMRPAQQAARITGWATTAQLPAVGRFDPVAACQLLVLGPGRLRPPGLPHRTVELQASGEPPVAASAPAAFAAWQALRRVAGTDVPDWAFAMATAEAPALLVQLAAATGLRRPVLWQGLVDHDPGHAAMLLAGWLAADGAPGLDQSDLDCLPSDMFLSGLDALAQPARALAALPLSSLHQLAAVLPWHRAVRGAVASDLAARLAAEDPSHPALPAIISSRLGGPPGQDLARLATPQVMRALGPGHAALAFRLTAGGIANAASSRQALAASLAAVRMATAR